MGRQKRNSGGPAPELLKLRSLIRQADMTVPEMANLIGMSTTALCGYLYSRDLPDYHLPAVKEVSRMLEKAVKEKQLPLNRLDTIKQILLSHQ